MVLHVKHSRPIPKESNSFCYGLYPCRHFLNPLTPRTPLKPSRCPVKTAVRALVVADEDDDDVAAPVVVVVVCSNDAF